jgi:V/A-type H+-transporting ATPase subunit F
MKIAVVTEAESAAGYRLAGLHVVIAADAAEAREAIVRMIQEGAYTLIATSVALLPDPYQALKREIRGYDLPVLLPVPSVAGEGEDAEAYVRRLVRATMGYEIKL